MHCCLELFAAFGAELGFSSVRRRKAALGALEGYELDEAIGQLYVVEYLTEPRNDGLMVKVIKFTETHQEGL